MIRPLLVETGPKRSEVGSKERGRKAHPPATGIELRSFQPSLIRNPWGSNQAGSTGLSPAAMWHDNYAINFGHSACHDQPLTEVVSSGALLSVLKAMHIGVRLVVGVKAEGTTQDQLVCDTTLCSTVTDFTSNWCMRLTYLRAEDRQ